MINREQNPLDVPSGIVHSTVPGPELPACEPPGSSELSMSDNRERKVPGWREAGTVGPRGLLHCLQVFTEGFVKSSLLLRVLERGL